MKANRGVVLAWEKSRTRWLVGLGAPVAVSVPRGTTLALHSVVLSMIEWNQTIGSCRVAY